MKNIKSLLKAFIEDFDNTCDEINDTVTFQKNDYHRYFYPQLILPFTPLIAAKSAAKTLLFDRRYIKMVQNTTLTDDVTVEHFITYIADVDGSIGWKVFKPELVNFKVVEALVKKGKRVVLMQFKINPSTKLVKIGYIEMDGKPASLSDLVHQF